MFRVRALSGRLSRNPHRRYLSSLSNAVVHVRGDAPYGAREYILLPANVDLEDAADKVQLASLRAHRNIIFAARSSESDLESACLPLLKAALTDASAQGEQPQALSTLHGLCHWAAQTIKDSSDEVVNKMDDSALEACKAMATGIPRPGHSVVGPGTWRDAQKGWESLAKEFVQSNPSDECRLYQQIKGCELVGIEYLASTEPSYMQSAGGSMARLFFVL